MKKMNLRSWISKTAASLALAGLGLISANDAKAVTFAYSSAIGAFINFDGASHFSFSPSTGNFNVTSGTASGLAGEITGTYTIGTITTSGSTSSAPVTGTGTFVIHDGVNTFSSTLVWVDVSQTGTGGTLNVTGAANLTAITYGGSNADLLALKNAGAAANTLTFQFVPAVTLADLKSSGTHSTSFSGTVGSVPDGGTTVAMLGFALLGVASLRRTIKAVKS
jgi:VPDSG-CTERM motif